jgi:hypothetical protein
VQESGKVDELKKVDGERYDLGDDQGPMFWEMIRRREEGERGRRSHA